ncbi:MAG: HupE/UreJ family protein [Hyphomicrobiaceae bacterium]
MIKRPLASATTVFAMMMPSIAFAHHGIDGRTPSTLGEGLISGLAHPVLGLDHLVFLLAAGLAAGALRLGLGILGLFIVASIGGLVLHLARLDIPLVESAIGATILALGLAAGSRSEIGTKAWVALFVVAGLLHGYAYGESIVGATAAPLTGYLLGLGIAQGFLASVTYLAGHKLADGVGHARPELRHLGALLAVIGVVFFFAALRTGA